MTRTWAYIFAAMLAACTGGAPPSTSGVAPASPTLPAQAEPRAGEPLAADPGHEEVPTTAVPFTPPGAEGPGEDWLVWWFRDGAWTTRWLRVDGDGASVVGERKALIVGDAARLWRIERADAVADVKACQCADEDVNNCPVIGKVGVMGLRARELDGDAAVTIREATSESTWGDDIAYGLAIVGGSQARLTVEFSESGYFCGAHGSYSTLDTVFDLSAGKAVEPPAADWWKRLPDPIRRAAAGAIAKDLNECEDSELSIDAIMRDRLGFAGATLALAGGAPTITWKLATEVMYICSPDYALTGTATSGLIPEAAPLGLGGPLPAGVTRALATIGEAEALGFSRLDLTEPARAAKVAAFTAAPEPAWPAQTTRLRRLVSSAAQAALDEGRTWTREKDYGKAIAAFDAAIAVDAELAAAYSGRGYARMLAGDMVRAKADFADALIKDDDAKFQAAVWFNLGALAESANDRDAARAAYAKSQALRPTKQAADAQARLGGDKP